MSFQTSWRDALEFSIKFDFAAVKAAVWSNLVTTKIKFETIRRVSQNQSVTKTVKNTKERFLENIFIAYVVASFGFFIIPEDILSSCKICRSFVEAMKQIFPNIQIFSDISPFKQEIEFYASYMWVLGLLLAIILSALFVISGKRKAPIISWPMSMLGLILSAFIIYDYFFGCVGVDGIVLRDGTRIEITFDTKFEIFAVITVFQLFFSLLGLFSSVVLLRDLFFKIFYREEESK